MTTVAQRRNRRAGVEDRWRKADGSPSAKHGVGRRWRARYVDESGAEREKLFARKVDAQAWLDDVTTAQVTGSYVDPRRGAITFTAFYSQWSQRQVWVKGTMDAMDLAAASVTFGDVPFVDLRPSHIEAWVKSMQTRGLEPSTIRTRYNNVRAVLRAAVRDRLLARDVAEGLSLPRQRKAAARMQIPTPAEVGELLEAADGPTTTFVAVSAFVGLRLGEVAGLRVSDVDFLAREIHVRRQVQRAGGGDVEIRGPKYGSERVVYAPAALVEILAEHVRLHTEGDDPDRWLWIARTGGPWHHDIIGPRWRRLRAQVGVEYALHDLRHYYASGLIASGCDVVTVQRALGHASAAITLSTYSHLWPSAEDRTRRAAEEMFAEATAGWLRAGASATGAELRR